MSLITTKTAIYIGEGDDLATLPDAKTLASLLPNVFHLELLKFPGNNSKHFFNFQSGSFSDTKVRVSDVFTEFSKSVLKF